ncbi:DUF222 domain-containing protein [Pengzhenrongella phosphoraccumulans]|uniref:HNH endonuclease n=1 Tax=Pengzhenrongella phosphoraccumulans TaxID=3114394 RepID=UPI00388F0F6F
MITSLARGTNSPGVADGGTGSSSPGILADGGPASGSSRAVADGGPVALLACRARSEVAGLRAAAAALAAVAAGASGWAGPERQGILTELNLTIDTLQAIRSAVLIAERDADTWRGSGDPSFEAWVGRKTRLGKRGGAARVRQAAELDTVPDVLDAVTEGRIPLEHAGIIAKVAASGTPAQREAATSPAGQETLLGLAAGQDAGTFARTADRWAAHVDPAGLERDHQAQRRARFLHLTHTPHGTHLKGLLDSLTGHQVALALEAATPRPAADDDRDYGQRNADALGSIADRILASVDTKPGAHVPPQVSVILTEATWLAAQADRDRRRTALATFGFTADSADDGDTGGGGEFDRRSDRDGEIGGNTLFGSGNDTSNETRCGAGPAMLPVLGYAPATLEDGTPVPASELGVIMCDCELTRIVINADGVPLDLGRTERLFTGAQRKAVIARDRECAWPDCHAHARWCHIHHLAWWQRDNGATSVENGALLCNFHHHEVHRLDLTLTRHTTRDYDAITGIARVWYQLTDPTGRQLRQTGPPGTGASPPEVGASPPAGPPERPGPGGPQRPGRLQVELDLSAGPDSLAASAVSLVA